MLLQCVIQHIYNFCQNGIACNSLSFTKQHSNLKVCVISWGERRTVQFVLTVCPEIEIIIRSSYQGATDSSVLILKPAIWNWRCFLSSVLCLQHNSPTFRPFLMLNSMNMAVFWDIVSCNLVCENLKSISTRLHHTSSQKTVIFTCSVFEIQFEALPHSLCRFSYVLYKYVKWETVQLRIL
jgi:hypothetical protein